MEIKKNVLMSKTFWFGLMTALAPLVPQVGAVVSENAATVSMLWGAMAIVLRFVTKDKVVLVE